MKLNKFLGAASLFALASVANATVLDFEGLTAAQAVPISSAAPNYGGFTWDAALYLYDDTVFPTPSHSGKYGIVNNSGANPISVSSTSAFTFNGAWLNGWSFNSPSSVTITGYDNFNNVVGSLIQSITVGTEVFALANFSNVYRLEFTGGQFFSIDDFTFDERPSSVPEPTSLALFGIGMLGLGAFRRRKTA